MTALLVRRIPACFCAGSPDEFFQEAGLKSQAAVRKIGDSVVRPSVIRSSGLRLQVSRLKTQDSGLKLQASQFNTCPAFDGFPGPPPRFIPLDTRSVFARLVQTAPLVRPES